MAAWRARNKERNLATGRRSDRKRRELHPEKMLAKRRANRHKVAKFQPEKARAQYLRKYRSVRRRAMALLGDRCACCRETLATMLEIDHIHNDGNIERKTNGWSQSAILKRILRMEDPRSRYQILCANCNKSKFRNGGQCEHVTMRVANEA